MRTTDFTQMVKSLKESKTLKVKDLEKCTDYQLEKIENVLLNMHLDNNLNKVLDIVTDMIVSNANKKVANKKVATKEVAPVAPVEPEPKKTPKKAPNKNVKPALDEPTGMDFKALAIGDIVTIYSNDIIDTVTTIVYKCDSMVVAVDLEDEVSYEFTKEFIADGGYKFKGKNYFLRLGK